MFSTLNFCPITPKAARCMLNTPLFGGTALRFRGKGDLIIGTPRGDSGGVCVRSVSFGKGGCAGGCLRRFRLLGNNILSVGVKSRPGVGEKIDPRSFPCSFSMGRGRGGWAVRVLGGAKGFLLNIIVKITVVVFTSECCIGKGQLVTSGLPGRPMRCIGPCVKGVDRLLIPACPAIRLPGDVLHICPRHNSFAKSQLNKLPLVIADRQNDSTFGLDPCRNSRTNLGPIVRCDCSQRGVIPCQCRMCLSRTGVRISCTPSRRDTICDLAFRGSKPTCLIFGDQGKRLGYSKGAIDNFRCMSGGAGICLCTRASGAPRGSNILTDKAIGCNGSSMRKGSTTLALTFSNRGRVNIHCKVSFVDARRTQGGLRHRVGSCSMDTVTQVKQGR